MVVLVGWFGGLPRLGRIGALALFALGCGGAVTTDPDAHAGSGGAPGTGGTLAGSTGGATVASGGSGTGGSTGSAGSATGGTGGSGAMGGIGIAGEGGFGATTGWSITFPGAGSNDQVHDVAIAPSGEILATGGVDGSIDLGNGTVSGGAFLLRLDPSGTPRWSSVFGTPDADTTGDALALGSDGSVVVVGRFRTPITFGTTTLTPVNAQNGPDAFVIRYDPTGKVAWAKSFGADGYDEANDVALDASGNVYVTGYVSGSTNFGGGMRTAASNRNSAFFAKYDPNGTHLASTLYTAQNVDASGRGIGVDALSRVWITGYVTAGSMDFGRGTVTSTAPDSVFLLGLSSNGTTTHSNVYGETGYHFSSGLFAVPSGSFAITGTSSGSIDFGGGLLGTPYTASSTSNAFVATFDPGGVATFSRLIPSSVPLAGFACALDAQGNLYIAGDTEDYMSPVLVTLAPRPELVHVYRYGDSDGRFDAIAVDEFGNVVVGGWLASTADFGFGKLTGDYDLVIAKFTPGDL